MTHFKYYSYHIFLRCLSTNRVVQPKINASISNEIKENNKTVLCHTSHFFKLLNIFLLQPTHSIKLMIIYTFFIFQFIQYYVKTACD